MTDVMQQQLRAGGEQMMAFLAQAENVPVSMASPNTNLTDE